MGKRACGRSHLSVNWLNYLISIQTPLFKQEKGPTLWWVRAFWLPWTLTSENTSFSKLLNELLHSNKHVEEKENLSAFGFKLILFCCFVNVNAEKKYSSVLFKVNFYSIWKLDTFTKLILNRICCLNEKILTFYRTVSQIILVSAPPE